MKKLLLTLLFLPLFAVSQIPTAIPNLPAFSGSLADDDLFVVHDKSLGGTNIKRVPTLTMRAYMMASPTITTPTVNGGTITGNMDFGTAGVRITNDGDGAITFLGLGDGSDENLTLNFDDTANTIVASSSTGVTKLTFSSIALEVPNDDFSLPGWFGDNRVPTKNAVRNALVTKADLVGAALISPSITTPSFAGAISFPDGVRQTFNPSGITPGFNPGSHTADPSTPSNGDQWYNSTDHKLRARINGVTVDLGAGFDTSANFTLTGTWDFTGAASVLFDTMDIDNLNADNLEADNFIMPHVAGTATLATAGAISLNTTSKQIGIHNGAKEVAISLICHREFTFDPKAVCDGAVDRLFLFKIGAWAPKGITITGWRVSFEADPVTEADLDLKRADAFIGVANAATMDVLDTTAGAAAETSSANINSGAVIAFGKVVYLEFGTAYSEANHQVIVEIEYEVEED